MNKFDEMRAAVAEAKTVLAAADGIAGTMAHLLKGRLRNVANEQTLVELKRELKSFNANTKKWEEDK